MMYKFISHRLNKQFLQEENIYTKIKSIRRQISNNGNAEIYDKLHQGKENFGIPY